MRLKISIHEVSESHKNEIEALKQSILEKEEYALKQIEEIEKLTDELLSENKETELDYKTAAGCWIAVPITEQFVKGEHFFSIVCSFSLTLYLQFL